MKIKLSIGMLTYSLVSTSPVAISLFREVYTTRFDSTYTALGLKVLEDEHLAKQFCSMKAGVARDLWILVKINLYRAQSGL